MAWQIPAPAGQWTAAMGIPQDMNMAGYTAEQWTIMQQQNWQQWNQWQQQYCQWQTQYGEKYAQHLQTGQPMAGMPPLPTGAAAPPAPPPPDQPPPPPPPHENNQPLFGNTQIQVSSVSAQRNTSNYSSTKSTTGNNQWPYGTDAPKEVLSTVNSDALNKLAEEEKSFDIQFQKWEEEIERWRKENVNHPDKQSYREYEERFELCRAQLLERRQQMQLKRARLLNNAPQTANAPPGNKPMPVPPPPSNTAQNNYKGVLPHNYKNKTYQEEFKPPSSYNQTQSSNKNIDPQDRYESYHDGVNQPPPDSFPSAKSDPTTFLPTSASSKSIPGLDLVPESSHSNKIQDVIDITDEPSEIQQVSPDYSKISKGINNILGDAKIMNILSMVKTVPQAAGQNLPPNALYSDNQKFSPNQGNRNSNNFDQDQPYGNRLNMQYNNQGPSFPMQQNQGSQYLQQQGRYDDGQEMQQNQYDNRNVSYGGPNNRGGLDMRQGGPGMGHSGFDMRPGGNMRPGAPDIRQGGMRFGNPDMRLSGPGMRHGGPNIRQGLDIRPGGPNMRQGGPDIRPNGPNMGQGGLDMRQSGPNMTRSGPDMRQGGPELRQGAPDMMHGSQDIRQDGPEMRHGGPDMRQGGPDIRQGGPDMRHGGADMRQGGPNMRPRGSELNQGATNMQQNLLQDMRRPNQGNQAVQSPFNNTGSIPSLLSLNSRPPVQEMSAHQNVDDYYDPEQPMASNNPIINQPTRPKWVEEPLFTPSLVVDYEHKPLRLKARDFIEPVHTFDYNHKSKDEDLNKKKDFEKEVQELFTRKPRRDEGADRFVRDIYHRDYERRVPREEIRDIRDARVDYRDVRDDFRSMRGPPRDAPREDFERRRFDDRFDDRRRDDTRDIRRDDRRDDETRDFRRDDRRDDDTRDFRRDDRRDERRDDRRDDRDRFQRRDEFRERDRERDMYRPIRDDRSRDMRKDDHRIRSRSKEIEPRKRALSKESEVSIVSKKSKDTKEPDKKHVVMIDDLLEPPGRDMRPEKLVIILRGLPGSGKSYLAKLIRDREAEHGGTARIMSIDDYFMQEGETEEKDPQTGKIVKKPFLKYEYDEASEETYLTSLKRAFKRSLTDGYFSFLIYDAVNDQLKHYADIWNFARQNGFQVYICTMEQDVQTCFKRNIHNRTLTDIEVLKARFFDTPAHHIQLDATTLLQSASITEVQMEDVEDDVIMEDVQEDEVESVFTSKWEKMDDAEQLARLDGTSKPLRPSQLSMEDYLQLDDWKPKTGKSNKKTVRWADIEERREQEKMRAIGFVVGQTDWNRMTDLSMGSGALTQTKYIERVRRN